MRVSTVVNYGSFFPRKITKAGGIRNGPETTLKHFSYSHSITINTSL